MTPPARAATLLFCHGTSFCKDIWDPVMTRIRQAPLLRRSSPAVSMTSFNFPYHGEKRDVSVPVTMNLQDPEAPRVHHPAMNWSTWAKAEVQRQVRLLREAQGSERTPLIGIGHSMGAAGLWATEAASPGTFDGLILFEPMVNADDYPNRKKSVDFLVSVTLKRRANWDSFEEAEAELLASRNFARWHPESLRAWIRGAVVKVSPENNVYDPESKYGLSCHPHFEAAVYTNDTMPLSDEEMAAVKCPVTFHYGARTQLFFPEFKQPLVERHPEIYKIREPIPNTTHALVMEDIDAVASRIVEDLAQLPVFRGELPSLALSR